MINNILIKQIICEIIKPELKERGILNTLTFKKDSLFSFNSLTNEITYSLNLDNDYFDNNIAMYLKNNLGLLEGARMLKDFNIIFSLFHEVGHYVTNDSHDLDAMQLVYNTCEKTIYKNEKEAFTTYRNIPTEKSSDLFAVELLNKYAIKLFMILENMNYSTAKDTFDFWNSMDF